MRHHFIGRVRSHRSAAAVVLLVLVTAAVLTPTRTADAGSEGPSLMVMPQGVDIPETGAVITFDVSVLSNGWVLADLDMMGGGTTVGGTCALEAAGDQDCVIRHQVPAGSGDLVLSLVANWSRSDDEPITRAHLISVRYQPTQISVFKRAADRNVFDVGGETTFEFALRNNGEWPMRMVSFVDDKLGNVDGQGNCRLADLAIDPPDNQFRCSLLAVVPAGTTDHTNTVTVVAEPIATDSVEPLPGARTATASFTIGRVTAGLSASKVAVPASVPATGGDVTFTFGVTNTSAVPVVINTLSDSVFGSLAGQGTCTVGHSVAPGQSYTCTVVKRLSGTPATPHQNTLTVTATATTVEEEDEDLLPADPGLTVDSAQATATLTATASTSVTFTAVPTQTGGAIPTADPPAAPAPTSTPAPVPAAAPVANVAAQVESGALAHTGRDHGLPLAGAFTLVGLGTAALGVVRRRPRRD